MVFFTYQTKNSLSSPIGNASPLIILVFPAHNDKFVSLAMFFPRFSVILPGKQRAMITFPNAKINLGLNIVGKRPDGYHNLETVFYPVPIEDALEICPQSDQSGQCQFKQFGAKIEGKEEDNLVWKAYRLLKKDFDLPPINIFLYKHIPSGAGLGGGSSDAAYMLKLLNRQFNLQITNEQLETYASRLGADCAFFIKNRPTFAEGIGEIFSDITLSLKNYQIYIVKPDVFVSTRDAFANIVVRQPAISLKQIVGMPIEQWKTYMYNDFEESIFPHFPIIREIKEEMYRQGAIYAAMSGSGSSVYGIFAANSSLPDLTYNKDVFTYHGVLD